MAIASIRGGVATVLDQRLGKGSKSLCTASLYLDSFVTEPGDSEAFGPDLAFVRIPSPSGFLSTLLAKKSFFDLSGPAVRNRPLTFHLLVGRTGRRWARWYARHV